MPGDRTQAAPQGEPLIESVSDADLLLGVCQDALGFNPEACFRDHVVPEARRRVEGAAAEVATLKAMVAKRDETIRQLDRYILERGRELRWHGDQIASLREEIGRLKAELARSKAGPADRKSPRSSRRPIRPTFICLD